MNGDELWLLANRGTDIAWSAETGNCGGCGSGDCHPGQPCPGVVYCLVCPHRRDQGLVR